MGSGSIHRDNVIINLLFMNSIYSYIFTAQANLSKSSLLQYANSNQMVQPPSLLRIETFLIGVRDPESWLGNVLSRGRILHTGHFWFRTSMSGALDLSMKLFMKTQVQTFWVFLIRKLSWPWSGTPNCLCFSNSLNPALISHWHMYILTILNLFHLYNDDVIDNY